MAAMIYFTLIVIIALGFLAIPAQPSRTFPAGGEEKAALVLIIYERMSSSSSNLQLDLPTILSAINHHQELESSNDGTVKAPIPKPSPPSPKPAPPRDEFTTTSIDDEGCDSAANSSSDDRISMVTAGVPPSRRKPPPPPAPKPASPTHPAI